MHWIEVWKIFVQERLTCKFQPQEEERIATKQQHISTSLPNLETEEEVIDAELMMEQTTNSSTESTMRFSCITRKCHL